MLSDDLLLSLATWECREDHDLGPGLNITQAWLQVFADGSGNVIAELSTVVDSVDNDVKLGRLLTILGLEGRMEKRLAFETFEEAAKVLQEPLRLNWRD